MRAGSAIALLAVTTAAGVAGFPASALAKPTSPHSTTQLSTASAAVANVTVAPSVTTAVITWDSYTATAPDHYVVKVNGTTECSGVVAAGPLTCTATTLVAGTSYTATVEAQTIGGVIVPGSAVGTSTAFKVGQPGAPTLPMATPNQDGTIDVSWTPPATVGAGIVTYTATTTPGSFTCVSADGDTPNCTISAGALRATPYTVAVVANGNFSAPDVSNDSAASANSSSFTLPLDVPTDAHGADLLTNGHPSGHITAGWTAPTDMTGIDHYVATLTPGGAHCPSVALALTCTISTGLTAGVSYTVSVVSVAADDSESAPSTPSTPVLIGPLYVPTGVMAMAGDAFATVSWTAPTGFPAGVVSYYTVTGSDGDVCNTPDDSVTHCTVTGLTNFRSATFTVMAHTTPASHLADSPSSAASGAVTPLPASITLKAAANGKYVTAENAGMAPLIANRAAANAYEKFWVTQNADGTVSLKAAANGKYVTADPSGAPLIANRSAIGTWEEFALVDDGGSGMFTLKAMSNGKYVSADHAGASSLVANRSVIGSWETFTLTAAS